MDPLPGPALMLPVIDLSGTPDMDPGQTFRRREAKFKRDVSMLHAEWCLCGSYLNHFKLSSEPLKPCEGNSTAGEDGAATTRVSDMEFGDDGSIVAGGGDGYQDG